jgi:hypothetical protein
MTEDIVFEYFIKDIRNRLQEIYPKLREYLQQNKPALLPLYENYYQQAMYNPNPEIVSKYAYRIFRAFVSIKTQT